MHKGSLGIKEILCTHAVFVLLRTCIYKPLNLDPFAPCVFQRIVLVRLQQLLRSRYFFRSRSPDRFDHRDQCGATNDTRASTSSVGDSDRRTGTSSVVDHCENACHAMFYNLETWVLVQITSKRDSPWTPSWGEWDMVAEGSGVGDAGSQHITRKSKKSSNKKGRNNRKRQRNKTTARKKVGVCRSF